MFLTCVFSHGYLPDQLMPIHRRLDYMAMAMPLAMPKRLDDYA